MTSIIVDTTRQTTIQRYLLHQRLLHHRLGVAQTPESRREHPAQEPVDARSVVAQYQCFVQPSVAHVTQAHMTINSFSRARDKEKEARIKKHGVCCRERHLPPISQLRQHCRIAVESDASASPMVDEPHQLRPMQVDDPRTRAAVQRAAYRPQQAGARLNNINQNTARQKDEQQWNAKNICRDAHRLFAVLLLII